MEQSKRVKEKVKREGGGRAQAATSGIITISGEIMTVIRAGRDVEGKLIDVTI